MRKFAFDWGGSLENNESLRQIARDLQLLGHEVWIIPAASHEPTDETYFNWLAAVGVPFTGFRRVLVESDHTPAQTALGKVAAMRATSCTILYDDNQMNVGAVRLAGMEAVLVTGNESVPRPSELAGFTRPKVYAFDVDDCMETSKGPVTVQSLRDLRKEGHIIGLCGALCRFMMKVRDWHEFISFTLNYDFGFMGWYGPNMGLINKAVWLHCFKNATFPGAAEYVMVGNIFGEKNSLGHTCGSHDSLAAQQAGWRFIKEDDFARGVR